MSSEKTALCRAQELTLRLLAEMEAMNKHSNTLQAIGDVLGMEGDTVSTRLNEVWLQATSLPTRIGAMQKLADTMQTLGMTEDKR